MDGEVPGVIWWSRPCAWGSHVLGQMAMGECVWGGSPVGRQEGRWEAEEVGSQGERGGQGGEAGRKGETDCAWEDGTWSPKAGTAAGGWWEGQGVSWESGGRDIQGGSVVGSTDPGALWGQVPPHVGACLRHLVCRSRSHHSRASQWQAPPKGPCPLGGCVWGCGGGGVWLPPPFARSLKEERAGDH